MLNQAENEKEEKRKFWGDRNKNRKKIDNPAKRQKQEKKNTKEKKEKKKKENRKGNVKARS